VPTAPVLSGLPPGCAVAALPGGPFTSPASAAPTLPPAKTAAQSAAAKNRLLPIPSPELSRTQFGYEAAQAALAGERAWGTQQQVNDMLVAYCTALENAILRIADEVEAIS
jgi:hypothetical protein